MRTAHASGRVAALLCSLLAVTSLAQESGNGATPEAPDFRSLTGSWWSYFEGTRADVEPRANAYLVAVGAQIAGLQPQNQAIAQSVLDAVQDNVSAYLELLGGTALTPQALPLIADAYALDELLELAAIARRAESDAAAEQLEVEREQRILEGASRRRDSAFKDYVDSAAGDAQWLAALRLLQARSAQAISVRRLDLLSQSHERATAHVIATADIVNLARDRLATTVDAADLDDLIEHVAKHEATVAKAQDRLRTANVAAIGLDLDTAEGRSQQRLEQQRLVGAEVELALAEAAFATVTAQRWWTELQLDKAPDMGALEEESLGWSELVRDIAEREPDWKRDTEEELIAVQSVNRDGLNRASRRLLDQRLGTAQEIFARIGELDTAVADLDLLRQIADNAAAEHSGAFRTWLISVSRQAKSFYQWVTGLGDYTLFSIGETPITGGDILRVFIILALALLLSRGIRHAIGRVGTSELAGTQASMYTVARLTHYAIIILAVIIALSSIGLDFSNLALVAGALGVGLGFGLQSIVSNFVSGLIILFEHTLRVGDYIELDTGLTGTVKAINVRSTLINTNDNIDIVVPNSEFVTTRLTNWTLGERVLRVRIPFGVAYGSDKELVRKAGIEAAEEVPFTLTHLKGREPEVWMTDFGDSSLNFQLLVWVNRQGARRPTRTRATYLWALDTKLAEHGIEIPFPQRDLHLRSGWPAASPDPASD